MQNTIRLFLALELSQEIHNRLSILINDLKEDSSASIRWVNPENIHLTVKFLGDTPAQKLAAIQQAAAECCKSSRSFKMTVKGTGVFPSGRQPRVLWAGLEAGRELIDLYRSLDSGMVELDFRKENRPFSPHLTLARINEYSNVVGLDDTLQKLFRNKDSEFGAVMIRRVTLFQSTLTREGPIYSPLARLPLMD